MNSEPAMDKKKLTSGILIISLCAAVFTVFLYVRTMDIAMTKPIPSTGARLDSAALVKPVVYIGVVSRYPPNIIYHGYQPILDYMTSCSPYRFELKLSDDYNQAVKLLINKEVAAAFLGSYVYVQAHREAGVIPLLKPLNENFEPFSRSVLITNASSAIFTPADLRGKRIALPAPESYSSNWMLKDVLPGLRLKPSDMGEIRHFPHHQSVIQYVSKNIYDAGVTREFLVKTLLNRSVRVIRYSDPYPTSPLVTTVDHPKDVIRAITGALLAITPQNPNRRHITRNWDDEFKHGFVTASDSDYDVMRKVSK